MIKAYDTIGDLLAYEIGNGKNIRVEHDPWVGCYAIYSLPMEMINHLRDKGILFLYQVKYLHNSSLFRHKWLTVEDLVFEGEHVNIYNNYIKDLYHVIAHLNDKGRLPYLH